MPTIVITAGSPSINASDVHSQCRIDVSDEDTYITGILIPAVEQMFLEETRCRLTATVLEQRESAWPTDGVMSLLDGPVTVVSLVTYTDASGSTVTLSSTLWHVRAFDDQSALISFDSMPNLGPDGVVTVRYTAGFPAIPAAVKLWLLAHVAHFYANREAAILGDLKPLTFINHLISKWLRVSI